MKKKYLILTIFIAFFISFWWFRKGQLFAGGEEGIIFYNLPRSLYLSSSIWFDAYAGQLSVISLQRFPYLFLTSILFNFSFSSVFLLFATFFIINFLALFYLQKSILYIVSKDNFKHEVAFLAAFFYIFNPFTMSQIFGRGLFAHMFAFSLMPTFFYYSIKFLNSNKIVYLYIAILFTVLFSFAYSSPTMIITTWSPTIIYYLYRSINLPKIKSKKEFLYLQLNTSLLIIVWVAAHMWWIYPNYFLYSDVYNDFLSTDSGNLQTLLGVSSYFKLPQILTLTQKFYFFGDSAIYGNYYSKFPMNFLVYLPIIFCLLGMLVSFIKKKYRFFTYTFIIGVFVCLGANWPTKRIFLYFFNNIEILQIFRNPYEKFGLVYMMAYSVLFACGLVYSLSFFSNIFSKLYVNTVYVIVLTSLLLMTIFYWNNKFAGGVKGNSFVTVPTYYLEANNWLNNNSTGQYKIINMPLISGDGVEYDWEGGRYQGLNPSHQLFNFNTINLNSSVNKPYYNVLLQRFGSLESNVFGPDPDISNSPFRKELFSDELALLNVGYVVLHNDLLRSGAADIEEVKSELKLDPSISYQNTFGKLDIYKVENNLFSEFRSDEFISYKRISPTKYNLTTNSQNIYFLQKYDENWVLKDNQGNIYQPEKYLDYFNKWTIPKSETNKNYIVKYLLQDKVYVPRHISVVSIAILAILLVKHQLIKFNN